MLAVIFVTITNLSLAQNQEKKEQLLKLFKPRLLSLICYSACGDPRPTAVFIDNKIVKHYDTLKPGLNYQLLIKFSINYEIVKKTIYVPPGKGPFIVYVYPKKLHCYYLRIKNKFLISNKIKVQNYLSIYVDGIKINSWHVKFRSVRGLYQWIDCYANEGAKSIKIVVGFYYEEHSIYSSDSSLAFRNFCSIDVNKLLEYLNSLANNTPIKAIEKIGQLLETKIDKERLLKLSIIERKKVICFLKNLRLCSYIDKDLRTNLIARLYLLWKKNTRANVCPEKK